MAAAPKDSTPTVTNSGTRNGVAGAALTGIADAEHAAEDHQDAEFDGDLRVVEVDAGGPRRGERKAGEQGDQQPVVHGAAGAELPRRGLGAQAPKVMAKPTRCSKHNYVA